MTNPDEKKELGENHDELSPLSEVLPFFTESPPPQQPQPTIQTPTAAFAGNAAPRARRAVEVVEPRVAPEATAVGARNNRGHRPRLLTREERRARERERQRIRRTRFTQNIRTLRKMMPDRGRISPPETYEESIHKVTEFIKFLKGRIDMLDRFFQIPVTVSGGIHCMSVPPSPPIGPWDMGQSFLPQRLHYLPLGIRPSHAPFVSEEIGEPSNRRDQETFQVTSVDDDDDDDDEPSHGSYPPRSQ